MKETIVLKSAHPSEYPDLVVECKVIPNDKITEYLENIPAERKVVAFKNGKVSAREGKLNEEVKTTLKTTIDGREYILHEEDNSVRERNGKLDIIVTNMSSSSKEEYIVKNEKFCKTYQATEEKSSDGQSVWLPAYDPRVLTQIDENVIIITSWGAPAVCLKGSYIVTYDAQTNDYNTLEKGAFESTYTVSEDKVKKL